MAVLSHPLPPTVSAEAERRKWWSTADFDALVGAGILEEGSNAYLWDGEIIEPMPENRAHLNAVACLASLLRDRFPCDAWTVDLNGPVELEDGTKPQPDVVLLAGPRARYQRRAPTPADIALPVEVSGVGKTYERDSGVRLRKYASLGIPRYWIVNIPDRRIEVYEAAVPAETGSTRYDSRTDFGVGRLIPFDVTHDGNAVHGVVPVSDVLLYSLDP